MSGSLLRYHPMDTHVKLFSLIEKHSFLYSLSNLLDIIKISDYEICFLPIPTAVCSKLNREKDCWLRFSWGVSRFFKPAACIILLVLVSRWVSAISVFWTSSTPREMPIRIFEEVRLMDLDSQKIFMTSRTYLYVEMPKFKYTMDELEILFDKWRLALDTMPNPLG